MKKPVAIILAALLLAFTADVSSTQAGTWAPTENITIIVPFAAGGGVDLVGRILADAMGKQLGVNVIVENIPGGGSLVGISEALNRAPDGYTLCMMTDSVVVSPYSSDTSISLGEYTPLARITGTIPTMTINARLPYNTLDEFVAAVKETPGGFDLATVGARGIWAVFAELFAKAHGLQFLLVPYDSGNDAQLAVAGGHIKCTMQSSDEIAAQVEAGNLRCLAVFSEERDLRLPDIPTAKEQGYDAVYDSFHGIMVPNGMNENVFNALSEAVAAATKDPDFIAVMATLGRRALYLNPTDFSAYLQQKDSDFKAVFAEWDN